MESLSPTNRVLLLWILFGGTHVLGSTVPVRAWLVARLGLPGFKGLYSLVAFATFIPLVVVYGRAVHEGPAFWEPSLALNLVAQLLMVFSTLFLTHGILTVNPLSTAAEMSGRRDREVRGFLGVTRHPLNTAFFLFGVSHLLANPFGADVAFFGGFAVYAVVSAWHQDRRLRATGGPEVVAFLDATSLVPLAAVVSGKQLLNRRMVSPIALVLGLGLFVVLRTWHADWIGGSMAGP